MSSGLRRARSITPASPSTGCGLNERQSAQPKDRRLCKENGITIIITEHRLENLIPIADRVIVMENGEIIESGSHKELMDKNGTYAYMFNLQAEKYKNAEG